MRNAIQLHPKDNVAMCLSEIKKGDKIILNEDVLFSAQDNIPFAHKVSLGDLAQGEDIIKYGYSIGKATCPIAKGQWVHVHNVAGGKRL